MKFPVVALTAVILKETVYFTDATSIKMDFLPVGHVRTDPIISQTCLSDHVHTFYGPQLVRPETTYDDLIATTPEQNTGNVEENKSLYWHPTVYEYNPIDNTYTRDVMAQTSAYYVWEHGTGVKAFPNGFRMIGGMDPSLSNWEVGCAGQRKCTRTDSCESSDTSFFPAHACDELEVSMSFPSCWDGKNLDSDDHISHVAYSNGDHNVEGTCPSSHPIKIPQIEFFFRIMPYSGGAHTFSDLTSRFHADYISGWDENFLQDVIDKCDTDSLGSNPDSFCEDFVTFRDGPKCAHEGCDFGDPALLQKLHDIQPKVPLDVTTVTTEETQFFTHDELPRGTCQGELLNPQPGPAPGPDPTPAPGPDPTPAPGPDPTPAPAPGPDPDEPDGNCEDACWDAFHECEDNNDTICGDPFLTECEQECRQAFRDGDLTRREKRECLNEWCLEDQEICYHDADRACRRRGRRCLRNCE